MCAHCSIFISIFYCYCLLLITTVFCNPNMCRNSNNLKYTWGDALTDSNDCIGPHNKPYPYEDVLRMTKKLTSGNRMGRAQAVLDPYKTRDMLLRSFELTTSWESNTDLKYQFRKSRALEPEVDVKNELCRVKYNTTAPKYGISLTSGKAVAIVQKFPDFLQQVVYEKCDCTEQSIIMGECKQTFSPRLMHVIPSGPVTAMGQDYILIESGCRMQLYSRQNKNQCSSEHNEL